MNNFTLEPYISIKQGEGGREKGRGRRGEMGGRIREWEKGEWRMGKEDGGSEKGEWGREKGKGRREK